MKTIPKVGLAILILGIAYSCKNASENENAVSSADYSTATTDSASVISSSAAVQPTNSNRKFVRTADIKF